MKNTILNKVSSLAKKSLTLCPPPFAGKVVRGLCTLLLLCASVMGWAASNLCEVQPAHPSNPDKLILLSWSTAENGNVVVTITPGAGVSEATFRTNGFTGDVNQFKVLSGDGFVTEENASKYFYEKANVDGQTTYTLYRTGEYNLPSPCQIKYVPGAVEWNADDDHNGYDNNAASIIIYNYGTICGSTIDAPAISVSSEGVVTFDAVEGADSYKAYVYLGSELINVCPISSGQKIWNPVLAGEYAFMVRAFNSSSDAYSDFSNSAIWNAAGDPSGDMPKSAVCGYGLKEGESEEAFLSFYTDRATGRFYITISAGERGDDSKTFFRDAGGLALDGFKYDGNTFTDYFTRIPESNDDINGKVNTLTFVPRTEEGHIPEYGHSITFSSGHYVTWRTFNNGEAQTNAYTDNLSFTYIYGTNCNDINDHVVPIVTVSTASTTTTSATLQIDVTDVNDYNEVGVIRSITVRDEANSFAERKVNLNSSNQVTLSDLTVNTIYNFTVKVTDEGGNVTEEKIKVPLTFDPAINLALNKTQDAGGAHDPAENANDGNKGTHWGTWSLGDYGSKNWWSVDLGQAYVLNKVAIYSAGYDGGAAHTMTIEGKMREEDEWSTILSGLSIAASTEYENIAVNASARYVKFSAASTENWMIAIKEFEVYGTAYAVADATAPEVTVTEIAKTVNTVKLQIDATDKDDAGEDGTINAIHISGNNDFETLSNVSLDGSNQITLSGLKDNKTYTFTVHVLDLAGNETTQNIVVELPFNTSYNIAIDGTATAGYCENTMQTADKANDGNNETKWNTYGVETSKEEYVGTYANNWWKLELDAAYNLSSVVANYQDVGTKDFVIEGSMDGANWYLLYKGTTTTTGEFTYNVSAPARYVRYTYGERYLAVYEFEVYASGFSTLTDAQPVITYTALGEVTDVAAEIEIDAVDMTTKPITKYMVSGLGDDAVEVMASEGKISLTGLSQSTHYTASIQAKDESGNLSDAKQVAFTTVGSASGLYFFSDYFNWEPKVQERARFSTTSEPGVLSLRIPNMTAGNHNFKLYNAETERCTMGDCGGPSDHYINNAEAVDVIIYATSEDQFITTLDNLYLRGTLVGEDQALEWNDTHTKAIWRGALDLNGTNEFTVVKKATNNASQQVEYDHDFFATAQTFTGDYNRGMFTLDLATMTGTWISIGLILDESAVNSSNINEKDNNSTNVALTRSFTADNLYTLVLPFDVDAAQMAAKLPGTMTKLGGVRKKANDDMYLNFVDVSSMEAGVAYLYTPSENVTNPVFENVVVDKVIHPSSHTQDDYTATYTGIYDAIDVKATITGTDKYVLGSDQWLYNVSEMPETMTMNAFRGYFTLNFGTNAAPGRRARVVFGDIDDNPMATDLEALDNKQLPDKRIENGQLLIIRNGHTYNAQGQLLR